MCLPSECLLPCEGQALRRCGGLVRASRASTVPGRCALLPSAVVAVTDVVGDGRSARRVECLTCSATGGCFAEWPSYIRIAP